MISFYAAMQFFFKTSPEIFLVAVGLLFIVELGDCGLFQVESELKPVKYTIKIRTEFGNGSEEGLESLRANFSQVKVTLRLRMVGDNVTEIRFVPSLTMGNGTDIYVARVSSGQRLGERDIRYVTGMKFYFMK